MDFQLQVGFWIWCAGKNELSPVIFLFQCNSGGEDSRERIRVEMDDLWGICLYEMLHTISTSNGVLHVGN